MLTNSQMKANRYLVWHRSRRLTKMIVQALEAGKTVIISTCLSHTKYTRRHAGMFKASKTGALVQSGKRWECIDYCGIKVFA